VLGLVLLWFHFCAIRWDPGSSAVAGMGLIEDALRAEGAASQHVLPPRTNECAWTTWTWISCGGCIREA